MAARNFAVKFSPAVHELRLHLCQSSAASKGVRDFLETGYVDLKKANPTLPILVRECSGVLPKAWARYDMVSSEPDMVSSEPDMVSSEPDMVSSEPDMVSSEPDMVSSEPDMVSSEPDMVSSGPDMVSSELDMVSSEPDMVSSEPEMVSSEPDMVSSEPVMVSSEPVMVSSEPVMVSSEPDMSCYVVFTDRGVEASVSLDGLSATQVSDVITKLDKTA
ncbi:Ribosomal protein/NADH dehydrogenase domain [Trinorchestia longiramus]|nr:Ribosomal protein/NADH dehydrogenase domain [Trinorchestia longiramus]